MQAIILCGGRGERLMPLTARTPSALLRIVGTEVILHIISQLEKLGVDEITLALGYGGEKIKKFFSILDKNTSQINFSQCELMGTAPAIEKAYNNTDENILVIDGNCVFDYDLKKLVKSHESSYSLCTALVKDCEERENRAFVKIDDKNRINGLLVDPSNHATAYTKALTGIFVINRRIFETFSFTAGQDFVLDILSKAVSQNEEIFALDDNFSWHKILTPSEFLDCQVKILSAIGHKIISQTESNFSGTTIIPPCYIGKNVRIEAGTIIEKGSVIDDGAIIKQKCSIVGGYVGKNAVLSQMCEIEKSVICENSHLEKMVHCGEYSIIGENSSVGSNTEICAGSKVWADRKISANSTVKEKYFTKNFRQSRIDEEGIFTICDSQNAVMGAMKFGFAVASTLNITDKIVVGYDPKLSGKIMHDALVCGLTAGGVDVFDVLECTLPQLVYSSFFFDAFAGIYVDVKSHCALRIFEQGGLTLTRDLERKIEDNYESEKFRLSEFSSYGTVLNSEGSKLAYESFLRTIYNSKSNKLNCEIRTYDSITAKLSDKIFRPKNSVLGEKIIFHVSADGKRLTAYSDRTGNVSWEKLSALGIYIAFENKKSVAVPFTYPSTADIIAENLDGRLYRYYNSSCGNFDSLARNCGKNPSNYFMNDAMILCAEICAYLNECSISFYDALKKVPDIYTTQRFVSFNGDYSKVFKDFSRKNNESDEGEIVNDENSKAIVRPLKNGNGIMIFAESKNCEMASELCDNLSEKIKRLQTP